MTHEYFMGEALKEAEKAYLLDEVPIGAVAVADNKIIARSFNLKESTQDPTHHAEILLLQECARLRGSWRLTDLRIYVTIEPCVMCVGALIQARVKELYFGARDPKFGAVVSLYEAATDERMNHRLKVQEGILAHECADIMKRFFQAKRQK